MNKLKCYYAHSIISYNSTIEKQDVELLEFLGFKVINPNTEEVGKYLEFFVLLNGEENLMDYFKAIIDDCDLVAFRSMPDLNILSGVGVEIQHALDTNKPIIELPSALNNRIKDRTFTKQFLIELGYYKIKGCKEQ